MDAGRQTLSWGISAVCELSMARIVLIPVRRSTVDDDGDLAMLGLGGARDKQEVRRRSVAKGLELSGNPTAVETQCVLV